MACGPKTLMTGSSIKLLPAFVTPAISGTRAVLLGPRQMTWARVAATNSASTLARFLRKKSAAAVAHLQPPLHVQVCPARRCTKAQSVSSSRACPRRTTAGPRHAPSPSFSPIQQPALHQQCESRSYGYLPEWNQENAAETLPHACTVAATVQKALTRGRCPLCHAN